MTLQLACHKMGISNTMIRIQSRAGLKNTGLLYSTVNPVSTAHPNSLSAVVYQWTYHVGGITDSWYAKWDLKTAATKWLLRMSVQGSLIQTFKVINETAWIWCRAVLCCMILTKAVLQLIMLYYLSKLLQSTAGCSLVDNTNHIFSPFICPCIIGQHIFCVNIQVLSYSSSNKHHHRHGNHTALMCMT